jgi:hypothetical protein
VPAPAVDGPYTRASLDALLYTRELAVTIQRESLAAAAAPKAAARGLSISGWLAGRVSSYGSTAHCAWLTLGPERGAALRALLGELRDTTPLSIVAPMCCGSLLAMVDGDRAAYPHVALALCGAEALARPPFARTDEAAFHIANPRARYIARPCRLCARGTELDIWHLALECPYPALRRLGSRRRGETLLLLREVSVIASNAIRAGHAYPPSSHATRQLPSTSSGTAAAPPGSPVMPSAPSTTSRSSACRGGLVASRYTQASLLSASSSSPPTCASRTCAR